MKLTATRVEGLVQVVILLAVGAMAGAASFTHVHDWTMANSPAATPDWFGWANAVISELTPIAAGLEARRRHRLSQPVTYPVTILVAAVLLSLAAQVAVAKPSPSGWLLSSVPALAFMALIKLVISRPATPEPTPAPSPTPAPEPAKAAEPADPARDAASTNTISHASTHSDAAPARSVPPIPAETFARPNGRTRPTGGAQ